MSLRFIYLILAVIGLFLPMTQYLPWLAKHGLALELILSDMFANGIAGAVAIDVILSFIVMCVLILTEGARLRISQLWLPIVGAFFFGVSFGLPLFLYMRQRALEEAAAA